MLGQELVGQSFHGHYEIIQVLGSGGMGTVYKAREFALDRIVAIKILHLAQIIDEESRLRFEREGKILSELSHKHIVIFYRFGVGDEGFPYIVTEYLEGPSLRSLLLKEGSLNWRRVLKIGIQMCEALQYAHEGGVVHRDLKPDNIILLPSADGDSVKLLDFGLAKILPNTDQVAQKLTRTGELIGSVHYMSPEQCLGQPTDNRSDIYSLGCVLYEAICGQAPLTADNPVALIYKQANETPAALSASAIGKELPPELDMILFKAMAKGAGDRYQKMSELKDDLELLLAGSNLEISVRTQLPVPAKASASKRSFLLLASLAGLLFMLVLLISFNQTALAAILSPIVEMGGNQKSVYAEQALAKQLAAWAKPQAAGNLYNQAYKLQVKIDKHSVNLVEILLDCSQLFNPRSARAQEMQVRAVEGFSRMLNDKKFDEPLSATDLQVLGRLVDVVALSQVSYRTVWHDKLNELRNKLIVRKEWPAALQVENLRTRIVEHQYGKREMIMEMADSRADVLIAWGKTRDAENLFEAVVKTASSVNKFSVHDVAVWHAAYGHKFYKAGHLDLATRHFELARAVLEDPAYVPAELSYRLHDRLIMAEIYVGERKIAKAMELYRKTLDELYRQGAAKTEYLARVAGAAQDLAAGGYNKEVIEIVGDAIKKYPQGFSPDAKEHPQWLFVLGDAYTSLHQYAEAVKAYELASSVCGPLSEHNFVMKAMCLLRGGLEADEGGDYAKAIDLVKRALEIMNKYAPENYLSANCYDAIIDVYLRSGQRDKALHFVEDTERALPPTPGHGASHCILWMHMSWLYFMLHRDELGEQYGTKALDWLSQHPEILSGKKREILETLSTAHFERKNFKKSLDYNNQLYDYIRSHPQEPVNDFCLFAFRGTNALIELGHQDKAPAELDKWKSLSAATVNKVSCNTADWLFLEARVLKRSNHAREATEIYQKILELPGRSPFKYSNFEINAMSDYAELLKEQGQKDAAAKWRNRARAEYSRQLALNAGR